MPSIKSLDLRLRFLNRSVKAKNYEVVTNKERIGELEFKVTQKDCIEIYLVVLEGDSVGFWRFLQQFSCIVAHDVLPDKVFYWERLGAQISGLASQPFKAVVFESEDFKDEDDYYD